jgi:hypothetical protein
MLYQNKYNKYLFKGGYIGCVRSKNDKKDEVCYIENFDNLVEKTSIFIEPYTKCSYSVWNESKSKLYVPTPPTIKDKLFKDSEYYIRSYNVNCSKLNQSESGKKVDIVVWSSKFKKWYEVSLFPNNLDPTLLNLGKEFSIMEYISDSIPINSPDYFAQLADLLTVQISQLFILRHKIELPSDQNSKEVTNEIVNRLRTMTTDSSNTDLLDELSKYEQEEIQQEIQEEIVEDIQEEEIRKKE